MDINAFYYMIYDKIISGKIAESHVEKYWWMLFLFKKNAETKADEIDSDWQEN